MNTSSVSTISQPWVLRYWPDPVLRSKCEESPIPVGAAERMIEIMNQHHGLGLSAPQVGLTCRLFVMRDPEKGKALVFANPEIVEHSQKTHVDSEGCLSIPGSRTQVKRFWEVDVEFDVPIGYELPVGSDRLTWHFEGLPARCIQHEMDHLEGIMIFDHINSNLGRKMFLEKYAKMRKKYDRLG